MDRVVALLILLCAPALARIVRLTLADVEVAELLYQDVSVCLISNDRFASVIELRQSQ